MNLVRLLNKFIKQNRFKFIFLLAIFIILAIIGVLNLNINFDNNLVDFNILSKYGEQKVTKIDILKGVLKQRLEIISTMYIIGMTILGIIFIPAIIAIEGFFTGFSIAYIINIFSGLVNWKVIMINLFFHLAILIPIYVIQSVNSLNISLELLSSKSNNIRFKIFLYTFYFILLLLAVVFQSIIETNIYFQLLCV